MKPVRRFSFEIGELVLWRWNNEMCVGIIVEDPDPESVSLNSYKVLSSNGTIQKVTAWRLREPN